MLPRALSPHAKRLFQGLLVTLIPLAGFAQGRLDRVEGHYVGALDFFNTQTDAARRVPHPNPSANGLQGNGDGWLGDGDVQVRGLMRGAQLNVDWWVLFGEPVADYTFVWQSSGRYEIVYADPKKGRVSALVSRDKLAKYPALLQRFDQLKPVEANFEIQWRIGDQSGKDREKFKQRYRLFGSIGSTAPHVKTAMTTRLHDGMFIYEPAGVKPFHAPSSPPGGWKAFGSLPESFDSAKIKMLADYFDISTGQVVENFRATKFRWPYGEMKALAQALARIDSGEEISPAEEAAKATAQKIPAYATKDEWAEAAPPPRPAAPPVPKRAADGLYYFCDESGNRVFSKGYIQAEPFGNGSHKTGQYIAAKVGYTNGLGLYESNYIDLTGQVLLPPNHADAWHIRDGLFVVQRYPVTREEVTTMKTLRHNQGLYDAVRKRYLLAPTLLHCSPSLEPDGSLTIYADKLGVSMEGIGPPDSPGIIFLAHDDRWDVASFIYDPATRTLKERPIPNR